MFRHWDALSRQPSIANLFNPLDSLYPSKIVYKHGRSSNCCKDTANNFLLKHLIHLTVAEEGFYVNSKKTKTLKIREKRRQMLLLSPAISDLLIYTLPDK